MRLRVLPPLAALLVAPLLSSCIPISFGFPSFHFTEPLELEFHPDGTVAFSLVVPPQGEAASLEIRLDDEVVPASAWTRANDVVTGTLTGVAPGVHGLTARMDIPLLLSVPVRIWTFFEVATPPAFVARGSIGQVHVTHANPGAALQLLDAGEQLVAEGAADSQGSLIFREVEPGAAYRVRTVRHPREQSPALDVADFASSTPAQSFYDGQTLEPGYGYLTTRDGTQLSVFVSLPGPPENGPYPVLVNYSGYDPSQPVGTISFGGTNLSFLCGSFPIFCDAPNAPEALIAGLLGFATVGVNMRGTGCSGGAYDFFEPLQLLDGYDIIETVAAQPWAARVGMIGISFPGISQLFVASTQPPNLAAITPLAVIDGVDTTMAPGGILNDGFAVQWGTQVLDRAAPYGHGWEQGRVDAGDTICEENQRLHSQKVDIIEKAFANPFYTPEVYDSLTPRAFVDRITVPVFTSGAWQDEQTGGHFPNLWDRFTGSPLVRYTGHNGAHADGFAPQVLAEWKNFLDFYVAEQVRPVDPIVRQLAPFLFAEIFGATVQLPEERFTGYATFADAKRAYEAEAPVRILMESGGSPATAPGAPVAGFELAFGSWPPPETEPRRFYLHGDGSLREFLPSEAAASSVYHYDEDKGQETYAVDGAFEKALPDITWNPWQPDRQLVFASEPFASDQIFVGHASADLWIQSTAADTDLEVTLSEIRPDGMETYVTSGWLRASRRALSAESTELEPVQTHLEPDVEWLPPGVWTPVRVDVYPFAHAVRAGSRIRMEISTPGANKGRWQFDVLGLPLGFDAANAVSHSAVYPSSLVLPAIPDAGIPTPLPACPSLRSQPCREYVPHPNARLE